MGFGIGAINTLILYTHFLSETYYGLITFLLSTANILMPLMIFGMHHAMIKFYSSYKNADSFLTTSLWLPLVIIIPISLLFSLFYNQISLWISKENSLIYDYTFYILLLGICMGYFELFFAWSRVQMKSVFGMFVREVFARLGAFILLFALYFSLISPHEFILAMVAVYVLRMLIMMVYALRLYRPKWKWEVPENFKEILKYGAYIILAGSAGTILLEIDKFMIPQLKELGEVAFYGVGIYIASVVGIPSRAMQQIVNPLTASAINQKEDQKVKDLYRKVSLNLLIIGGLLFLWINLGVQQIYQIIDNPKFEAGIPIVLIISIAELYKLFNGNANTVLTNSKYYRFFFYTAVGMALLVVALNHLWIPKLGISGAAYATLTVVLLFGTIKMVFLRVKMNLKVALNPTWITIAIIGLLYFIFSTQNWFLEFNPWIGLTLQSILIAITYIGLVYLLKLSSDLNLILNKFLLRRK